MCSGFRVQGVGWFRTFYRAFGGAALRVHVFDARVDAAISHVTVIPAPRTEALAGSVAKTPAMLVALVRKRALGRAALRVHVLDARVDTTVMNEAVIPAPPAPALAGSVAQATPVLVAGGINRAGDRAAIRVHILDARVDTASCRIAVLPAPPRKALAGSIVQAPPLVGAVVLHRAFDRAVLRVHVLDARVTAVGSVAVRSAPASKALAHPGEASAPSVVVAGAPHGAAVCAVLREHVLDARVPVDRCLLALRLRREAEKNNRDQRARAARRHSHSAAPLTARTRGNHEAATKAQRSPAHLLRCSPAIMRGQTKPHLPCVAHKHHKHPPTSTTTTRQQTPQSLQTRDVSHHGVTVLKTTISCNFATPAAVSRACSRPSALCRAPHKTHHRPHQTSHHRGVGQFGVRIWTGKQQSGKLPQAWDASIGRKLILVSRLGLAHLRRTPHKTRYNPHQRSVQRVVGPVGARTSTGSGDPPSSPTDTKNTIFRACSRSLALCRAPQKTRQHPQQTDGLG